MVGQTPREQPARRRIRWLAALVVIVGCLGPGAAGASATNLLYYGGPVVHAANIVLVEWGPDVRSSYTNSTSGDPGFFRYLASQNGATSDIGGVLAQYMDRTGQNSQNRFGFIGSYQISPAVAAAPPGQVLDSDIHTELTNQIRAGALPSPSGNGLTTIYVVLFPPGDNVCFDSSTCAFGTFCAYHGSFVMSGSSTQILYAAMVDNGPGTPNYGGCGSASSDVASQTSVVSHEVAETINDPLDSVTSWYDFSYNGEIADKCDAQPLGSNGSWTVEPLWSNLDRRCAAGESAYQAPTASFLAPSTGTTGQTLGFDASSSSDPSADQASALNQNTGTSYSISSGIVSYRWDWGDGSAATTTSLPTAAHTFAATGNYQVSLTVTDQLGFTSTKTQEVSVSSAAPGQPVVSTGTASGIGDQGATLNGAIDPSGQTVSYQFAYGTSPSNLDQATPATSGPSGESSVAVSATIGSLSSSTTYYYQLVVSAGGQTYSGAVQSFATTSSSPPPQTPTLSTGSAGRISPSGAILSGMVNPGGPARVQYAFAYGTSSSGLTRATAWSTLNGGDQAAPVTAPVGGLAAHTRYYYRLRVSLNGHTYAGVVRSFTTAWRLARVLTGSASSVKSNSAVVSGSVNPHGSYTIYQAQFGTTAGYGHSTTWLIAGSGTASKRVRLVLLGLRPHTTYHYRLVAQSSHGTTVGAGRTFTTGSALRAAPRFDIHVAAQMAWRRLTAHPLRVRFTCSRSCLAHFMLVQQATGLDRMDALPIALARAQGRLRHGGSGSTGLRVTSRLRRRLHYTSTAGLKLLVLAYATAAHSAASPPLQATVKISG